MLAAALHSVVHVQRVLRVRPVRILSFEGWSARKRSHGSLYQKWSGRMYSKRSGC